MVRPVVQRRASRLAVWIRHQCLVVAAPDAARPRPHAHPRRQQRRPGQTGLARWRRHHGVAVRASIPRPRREIEMTSSRFVVAGVTLGLLLFRTPALAAEWQLRPFAGATYGGDSTFLFVGPTLLAPNPNHPHFTYGVSGLLLGEIFGVEADFGHTPGFFQASDAPRVIDSGVFTLTGNLVVAMPRHLTQYTLRPYLVGGAGMMHVEY